MKIILSCYAIFFVTISSFLNESLDINSCKKKSNKHFDYKKKKRLKRLGCIKESFYNKGEANTNDYGEGNDYGVLIKYPGYDYKVGNINLPLYSNSIDSILYKFNIYRVSEKGLPSDSLIKNEISHKSKKGEQLINIDILDRNIIIRSDVFISYNPEKFWYNEKNDNFLFYKQCRNCGKEESLFRNRNSLIWEVGETASACLFIEVENIN